MYFYITQVVKMRYFMIFNNLCLVKVMTEQSKLVGWLLHLCYNNFLKMAPGCRNLHEFFYMCYVYCIT
jgi:hypothetical protein